MKNKYLVTLTDEERQSLRRLSAPWRTCWRSTTAPTTRSVRWSASTRPASSWSARRCGQCRRNPVSRSVEWHYTPKHESWLDMAEIELSVLARQRLDRRIGTREELEAAVAAWEAERNERGVEVKWRFTTADAHIKLHRLYASLQ
jgi:hypothetical protein